MVISGEVLDCTDGHGNVYPTFAIIPLKIDATVELASPILNNFVPFSVQHRVEVLEIFITDVFDSKVIDTQVKPDGA
jgi:hypothetical protein